MVLQNEHFVHRVVVLKKHTHTHTHTHTNMAATLPDGWEKRVDKSRKKVFYVHKASGKMQWNCPIPVPSPAGSDPGPPPTDPPPPEPLKTKFEFKFTKPYANANANAALKAPPIPTLPNKLQNRSNRAPPVPPVPTTAPPTTSVVRKTAPAVPPVPGDKQINKRKNKAGKHAHKRRKGPKSKGKAVKVPKVFQSKAKAPAIPAVPKVPKVPKVRKVPKAHKVPNGRKGKGKGRKNPRRIAHKGQQQQALATSHPPLPTVPNHPPVPQVPVVTAIPVKKHRFKDMRAVLARSLQNRTKAGLPGSSTYLAKPVVYAQPVIRLPSTPIPPPNVLTIPNSNTKRYRTLVIPRRASWMPPPYSATIRRALPQHGQPNTSRRPPPIVKHRFVGIGPELSKTPQHPNPLLRRPVPPMIIGSMRTQTLTHTHTHTYPNAVRYTQVSANASASANSKPPPPKGRRQTMPLKLLPDDVAVKPMYNFRVYAETNFNIHKTGVFGRRTMLEMTCYTKVRVCVCVCEHVVCIILVLCFVCVFVVALM